jgi:hypothetical protein
MADWWTAIKIKAGACAANTDIDGIKASVELAQDRVGKALKVGSFVQGHSEVFGKLTKANEGLGKMSEGLQKATSICKDIVALGKIQDAITVLMDDRIMYDDPQKAADSFDLLFQGFGRLCSHLPSPAKEWAGFFENYNLFGTVQKKVYAPHFRAANAALDQNYAGGERD